MTSSEWVLLSDAEPTDGLWSEAAVATLRSCNLVEWVDGAHQMVDADGRHVVAWWQPRPTGRTVPVGDVLPGIEDVPAGTWWTDVTINDGEAERAIIIAQNTAARCGGRLLRRA